MARYTAGCLTSAGTSARPIISLYSATSSAGGAKIVEVGVTNTTTTAVALRLVRLSTRGTPGTALTESKHDPNSPAAVCEAFNTHTADATVSEDLGYRASLGASVGSGIIWNTDDLVLAKDATGATGIGVIIENGTGQACQAWITWEE